MAEIFSHDSIWRSTNSSLIFPSRNSFFKCGSALAIIQFGKAPEFFSIIKRCYGSAWVSKRSSPVSSSIIMHPIDQTSLISFHLQHSRITSGLLYCLVLIIELWWSSYFVAPPKSMILILLEDGKYLVMSGFLGCSALISSSYSNKIFSGFRSVWVYPIRCKNARDLRICLKNDWTIGRGNPI